MRLRGRTRSNAMSNPKLMLWLFGLLCFTTSTTAAVGAELPSNVTGGGRMLNRASNSPKIYVYNLDERFRDSPEAFDWQHTSLYGLEMVFPPMLFDSPYITEDPEEADYFYVHAWLYFSRTKDINRVLSEIAQQPWWDRNGGRDHIFTISHDKGICDITQGNRFIPAIKDSIIMGHWGDVSGVKTSVPCHLVDIWPDKCDQVFAMVDEELNNPTPCYVAGKDLLVPTSTSENENSTKFVNVSLELPQDTLIMFGGGINQTHLTHADFPERDAAYSFGVRQTFARLYHGYPRIKIFNGMVEDYWEQVGRSRFCLAPAGWGWGARVKGAITHGCIPVVIQDGIKVEWEDELPMQEFAIRMPFMYLHRLPELLHRFERIPGRVEAMQRNLKCVWRLYWWNRPHGRAFEMTMCTLKARKLNQTPRIDFSTCTLFCGEGEALFINSDNSINGV